MSVGPKSVMPASAVDRSIEAATGALLALQRPDGHWVFELEADATIPAEYVLLRHYLAEPVDAAAAKLQIKVLSLQVRTRSAGSRSESRFAAVLNSAHNDEEFRIRLCL